MARRLPAALVVIVALVLLPAAVAAASPQSSPGASLTQQTDYVNFGTTPVATNASAQVITYRNDGNLPASMSIGAASAPFSVVSTTCGATLAPFATCTVTYGFTPVVAGPATGTATITSDGGSVLAHLSGFGGPAPAAGSLVISAQAVDFGSVVIGSTPVDRIVTVYNEGLAALTGVVVDIPSTGDTTATHNCPATLASGASCTVTLTYAPTGTGSANGSIEIDASAPAPGFFYVDWDGLGYPALVVPDASYTTPSATPYAVTDPLLGLLEMTEGVGNTIQSNTNPAHGTVAIAADGTFNYKPAVGWAGADSFTYTVVDYAGSTATGTITITVGALAATGSDSAPLVGALGLGLLGAGGLVVAMHRRSRRV